MQTRTITPPQWRPALDSLSRVYQGSSATLEILDPDLGAQFEIEETPLLGISVDPSGIQLDFETHNGEHLLHRIAHPKSVLIDEDDDGQVVAIQFEADDDPRNVLRLHSPIASKLLPLARA
jgi:hypothetical protein